RVGRDRPSCGLIQRLAPDRAAITGVAFGAFVVTLAGPLVFPFIPAPPALIVVAEPRRLLAANRPATPAAASRTIDLATVLRLIDPPEAAETTFVVVCQEHVRHVVYPRVKLLEPRSDADHPARAMSLRPPRSPPVQAAHHVSSVLH